jgi:hypothetical protein
MIIDSLSNIKKYYKKKEMPALKGRYTSTIGEAY